MAKKNSSTPHLKLDRRQLIGGGAIVLLCALALSLNSQNITLTTSYPAPSGVYAQIITTGGDPNNPQNTILARDRGNVLLSPNGAGKVGVWTANPSSSLDITGNIAIRDGTQGVGKLLASDANGLASWYAPDIQYLEQDCYCGSGYPSSTHCETLSNGSCDTAVDFGTLTLTCPSGYQVLSGAAYPMGNDEAGGAIIKSTNVKCTDESVPSSPPSTTHIKCTAACIKF